MTDAIAILALLQVPGVGYVNANRLLTLASSREVTLNDWFGKTSPELTGELGVEWAREIDWLVQVDEGLLRRAGVLAARVTEAGGYFVVNGTPEYPVALRDGLSDAAPPVLSLSGPVELLDQPSVAIVGARKTVTTSLRIAQACAELFAQRGVVVVSGGASGVDSTAHDAALHSEVGNTIVVLPQGLLSSQLSESIQQGLDEGRVVLLSGFQPDALWSAQGALTRNAQICALSSMVCAIEPKNTGGTIHAATTALNQGVHTLCFSANEDNPAVAKLLHNGAAPLLNKHNTFDADYLWSQWESASQDRKEPHSLF